MRSFRISSSSYSDKEGVEDHGGQADEVAAEAAGVPTLRLKLISTTLSGALMGMAGAPLRSPPRA